MNGVLGHVTNESESRTTGMEWGWGPLESFPRGLDGSTGDWIGAVAVSLLMFGVLFSVLKGKYGFALLAAVAPGPGTILAIVGGIRLAKPRSFWARHLYDRKTMAISIERHEPPIDLDDYPEPKLRRGYEPSALDEVRT